MEKLAVERSIWINAPRERVWQAVTDPQQIPQWFLPAVPMPMVRHDDGTLAMQMGEMEVGIAILESLNPPQKVTCRGLPDRLVVTTYTLEEETGGTRVTVTMTGFESLPEDARLDRLNVSGKAWEQALENLKAYVTGMELPFPQAPVAPLFGYMRETGRKLTAERSIWINAPRERVWQALTDPAQVEQWFAPGTTFKSTGSEVGARLYVENSETGAEMYVQILEVVDPPSRLVLRSQPEPPEMPDVTGYLLIEENNGTRLILTYSMDEGLPEAVRRTNLEQHTVGFGMMLGNVKAVIEGTPLPVPQGF